MNSYYNLRQDKVVESVTSGGSARDKNSLEQFYYQPINLLILNDTKTSSGGKSVVFSTTK